MSEHRDAGTAIKCRQAQWAGGVKAALLNSRQMVNVKNGCNGQKRHSEKKNDSVSPKNGETVPVCTDLAGRPVPADVHGHYLGNKNYQTGKITLSDCLSPEENC